MQFIRDLGSQDFLSPSEPMPNRPPLSASSNGEVDFSFLDRLEALEFENEDVEEYPKQSTVSAPIVASSKKSGVNDRKVSTSGSSATSGGWKKGFLSSADTGKKKPQSRNAGPGDTLITPKSVSFQDSATNGAIDTAVRDQSQSAPMAASVSNVSQSSTTSSSSSIDTRDSHVVNKMIPDARTVTESAIDSPKPTAQPTVVPKPASSAFTGMIVERFP